MIHPFLQMPIFGVVWYQGEANAGVCFKWNNYKHAYTHVITSTPIHIMHTYMLLYYVVHEL